jgi:hypothetical protein
MSLCFLLIPKIRKNIFEHFRQNKSSFKFLGLEELMTFIANVGGTYVLALVPVTLARGLGAFTPFIVLFYGAVLQKFFPRFFHENVDRSNLFKKLLLFVLTLVGVYLIVLNEV